MTHDPPTEVPQVDLVLDVDVAGLGFTGRVSFPADYPLGPEGLDADGLEIRSVRQGGSPLPFTSRPDGTGIVLRGTPHGPEPIAVDFSGKVETKSLFGLYRSPHGPGTVLTTHCEPTGARKIFPCVDRPDRKVRLALTVRAPSELEVVSNAPVRASRVLGSWREWVFEPTPPMSTYLLYLGIGKFDRVEASSGRVKVSVLAPVGRRASCSWAAEMAPKVLAACEAYYRIAYPLPKLDLLAIPEHAFGAMENWGAISFQESRLLLDGSSTSFSRRDIVETTAHEIAHQWFGNLVTMAWWDDIWLNESFAALMETKITEAVAPELDPWTDFFLRTAGIAAAVDADSLRSTHPIRAAVAHPEELSQIFDEISYGKGSAVLAMLDSYLGAEKFQAGVNQYLERFRYANARTDALWQALEEASGEKVAEVARPWTERAGFPVVTARLGAAGLELSQRRFSYLGSTDDEPWPIPMVVDVDGERRHVRFDQRRSVVPVNAEATVHLNPGAVGFYRVLYDEPLLERLLGALPARPPADRWSLLQDLHAFVLSGDVGWESYVRAARALRQTDDRLVVETIAGAFGGLALAFPDLEPLVRDAREFFAYASDRFGLEAKAGEPSAYGILRDRISFTRVRLDRGFAAELSGRFSEYDRLDPNLRSSVAVARVRDGGAAGYDEVRGALDAGGRTAQDALRFARALAWSPEPGRVRKVLDLASSGAINRSHVLYVAGQAAVNPAGRAEAWAWLRAELDTLTAMFRGSGYLPLLLDQTLPLVGVGRSTEVETFFRDHPTAEGARGLAKGLERLAIEERVRLRLATVR